MRPHGRSVRRFLLLCPLLASLLIAAPAAAQTADEKETARALMAAGDRAWEAKDYPQALKSYVAADALVRIPTTGVWVAKAYAQVGRLIEARDAAIAVTRLPRPEGESAVRGEARAEAQALADALAARIPSVVVEVSGPPAGAAVTVTLDGKQLPPELLGLPYKVDPGKHLVTATADGWGPGRADVEVREGESKSVALALVASPGSSVTPPPASTASEEPPAETSGGLSPLVWVGGGLAVVGLGVGAVTGILALGKASDARELCVEDVCDPAAEADADASDTLANVSNVGFAVAVVAAGLAVVGLVISGDDTPTSARVTVGPTGLMARGSF